MLSDETDAGQGKVRILGLCCAAYLCAYLMRQNFSVTVPLLVRAEGYSNTALGTMAGLYCMVYTLGQLLNGALGDRMDSRRMLLTGLFLSAVCNIGCGLSRSPAVLGMCWVVNGYAQSMLWGPILRTLAEWYEPEERGRVTLILNVCIVAGCALSWLTASLSGEKLGWRAAFLVPALPAAGVWLLLFSCFRSRPGSARENARPENRRTASGAVSTARYLLMIDLPVLFVMAAVLGIIREGIGAWLPTWLSGSGLLPGGAMWRTLVLVPLVNLAGVLAVQKLSAALKGDNRRLLGLVFLVFVLLAALLTLRGGESGWAGLILMTLLMAAAYGAAYVFTTAIPFELSAYGRVSMTAGVMDFSIYCGAAISGRVVGVLLDRYSWNRVYLFWLTAAAVGFAAGLVWLAKRSFHLKDRC